VTSKLKTFFEKIGAELKKLFGNTTWEKQAIATIEYVSPLLDTFLTLVAGAPVATAVQGIINQLQTDLATVSTVASETATAPSASGYQTAENALNSIKANAPQLLAAADIKDEKTLATATSIVDTLVSEADAVLANLPSAPAAPAAPAPATT